MPGDEKINDTERSRNAVLYLHDIVFLLSVIIILLLLVFRVIVVVGSSMYHTFFDGDLVLLLSNTIYTDVKQGDVVVISKKSFDDGTPIIKRVIATEGQEVDIDFEAGKVYVDGVCLDEPYTNTPTNTDGGIAFPLVVERGHVFVLGDNRNRSRDSRFPEIGQIDEREILGKAIFLLFPGKGEYNLSRNFQRIGFIHE